LARFHLVELDDEVVVFDEVTSSTHYLPALSLTVWRAVHANPEIDEASLLSHISTHYDIEPEVDPLPLIREALDRLRRIGLIDPE